MISRHGGQILVDQLKIHGVSRVFSVPGESFLAALDGLHGSGIENIVCRHEGGASMMAEAHGKLTQRPGVAFVTRGPGATNAASGLHVAMQDSTPMILFVGQIARTNRDRRAFQEVAYRQFFGSLVKWVAEIDQTERLPEYIARAFHIAQSGRPGPVVLALPEDMLSATAQTGDRPQSPPQQQYVSQDQAQTVVDMLETAQTPLVIAGGANWSARTAQHLEQFAQSFSLPVAAMFRRQDYLNNNSPAYVGDLGVSMNPALAQHLTQSDCLLLLGAPLGDIETAGFKLRDPRHQGTATLDNKTMIQIIPDPDEAARVYTPDYTIISTPGALLEKLAPMTPPKAVCWQDWQKTARADYEQWQQPIPTRSPVKMEQIVTWMSQNAPEDILITNGAGNYATFVQRYFRYRGFRTQLAPVSGSMGYGFPAAIAAKLEHPERTVVCFAGDGCFQMTLNEMSTAIQYGVAVVVIVFNNGKYGTIRLHQERTYPGRVSGTDLANPDFSALAQAYGAAGFCVERTEDFVPAFNAAVASNRLAVIELKVGGDVISTSQTIDEARAQGEARQKG